MAETSNSDGSDGNNSSTSYNITIDNTAPQIIYHPATSTDTSFSPRLDDGWFLQFNESGFASFPGQPGEGESFHVTQRDGANISLAFTGECTLYFDLRIGMLWKSRGEIGTYPAIMCCMGFLSPISLEYVLPSCCLLAPLPPSVIAMPLTAIVEVISPQLGIVTTLGTTAT